MTASTNLNSTLSGFVFVAADTTSSILPTTRLHTRYLGAIGNIPLSVKVIMGILLLFGVISGLLGNILVLAAVLLDKTLRSKTSNVMILSLSVTDLLMALVPMPILGIYFVLDWPEWRFGDDTCKATVYIANVCGLVSVLTMVLIAFDRYFAIVRNKLMLSHCNVVIALGTLWVTGAGALIYPVSSGGVSRHRFRHGEKNICSRMSAEIITEKSYKNPLIMKLALGVLVQIALLLIYARIGYFIWRTRHGPSGNDTTGQSDGKSKKNKTKALKLMFTIVLAFIIFWIPYEVNTFLRVYPVPKSNRDTDPTFMLMAYLLAMLNSSVNPVLYALVSEKLRTAYKNFLKRLRDRLVLVPALPPRKDTGQSTQDFVV